MNSNESLTREQVNRILEKLATNSTMKDIVKEHNICYSRLKRLVEANGKTVKELRKKRGGNIPKDNKMIKRNAKIICDVCNPNITLQKIANKYEITNARVQQIACKAGIKKRVVQEMYKKPEYEYRSCVVCGNNFIAATPSKTKTCSKDCKWKSTRTERTCIICGDKFWVRTKLLKDKRIKAIFCSNRCQGTWLGKNNKRGITKK